jgi:hypothetical protein
VPYRFPSNRGFNPCCSAAPRVERFLNFLSPALLSVLSASAVKRLIFSLYFLPLKFGTLSSTALITAP